MTKITRARLLWRLLFLQAGWSFRGMQNEGFAFAIDPWRRLCHRDPEALREARARHLEFFNTNPYMAGLVLGAACRLEEAVASAAGDDRETATARAKALKAALASTLAAVGDAFFWGALRPACAAFAGALFLALVSSGAGPRAAALAAATSAFMVFFTVGTWVRWRGLGLGYAWGGRLPEKLAALRPQAWIARVRWTGLFLAAAALLTAASPLEPRLLAAGTVSAAVLAWAAARGWTAARLYGLVAAAGVVVAGLGGSR